MTESLTDRVFTVMLGPTQQENPMAAINAINSIECGKEAAKHFLFEKGWRNVNHGSFGTYPNEVRSVMRYVQDQCELHPDFYIRYEFPRLNDEARKDVANVLNAPVDGIVFVPNATTGVNTVLRNLAYQPGDVIIYFSTIYGSCHKTIEYLMETTPVQSHGITYTYPCTDAHLCAEFEKAIESIRAAGKNPKVAVFDTIVSLPGVRMPFGQLTELCRQHEVLSCIDGAHSLGQIPMDLTALNPDFYVSNAHKWLFAPRGCAVMYVPFHNQHLMRSSLPTSHGFVPRGAGAINNPLPPSSKSEFVNQFEFVGTVDNAPYLCVPAAVAWRRKVTFGSLRGEEAIMRYCVDLAREGGAKVAEMLGTDILDNEEGTLRNCAFANIRLPVQGDDLMGMALWISKTLADNYPTFMALLIHGGKIWVRLSAQIYLTLEDFEWSGTVLKEVCERANKGEWKKL